MKVATQMISDQSQPTGRLLRAWLFLLEYQSFTGDDAQRLMSYCPPLSRFPAQLLRFRQ
jgi:hypothetical protein